mmetsp:Transcript_62849/g.199087  ORF Transcript_62849/g.199087 Transcript_62849/m.199087 type:complete len:205 (+) Transcript_62849:2664-3278(+)
MRSRMEPWSITSTARSFITSARSLTLCTILRTSLSLSATPASISCSRAICWSVKPGSYSSPPPVGPDSRSSPPRMSPPSRCFWIFCRNIFCCFLKSMESACSSPARDLCALVTILASSGVAARSRHSDSALSFCSARLKRRVTSRVSTSTCVSSFPTSSKVVSRARAWHFASSTTLLLMLAMSIPTACVTSTHPARVGEARRGG